MAAFLRQDKIEEFADTWERLIQHEEIQKGLEVKLQDLLFK